MIQFLLLDAETNKVLISNFLNDKKLFNFTMEDFQVVFFAEQLYTDKDRIFEKSEILNKTNYIFKLLFNDIEIYNISFDRSQLVLNYNFYNIDETISPNEQIQIKIKRNKI